MKRLFLSLALALGIFAIPLPSFATVQSTVDKKIYQGDGYSTSFSFPYNIYLATDLAVYETIVATSNTTQLVLNTNYSITLTAISGVTGAYTATINLAGGSSPAGALAVGTQLTILRSLPLTQLINISDYSATPAATWNQALDRDVIREQQLQEQINRAILAPVNSTAPSGYTLPNPVANAYIGWDATGTFLTNLIAAQPLGPTASPTFAGLTITGLNGIAKYSSGVLGTANADVDYSVPNGVETLTNKTYDTAGAGNVFKINGTQITSISGNTAKVATTSGSLVSGDSLKIDANGNIIDSGGTPLVGYTVRGNTTVLGTVSGTPATNNCAKWDANHNLVDNGSTCSGGTGMTYPGSSGIVTTNSSVWTTSISGTSSQFVKGDGSLDSTTYVTGTPWTTASTSGNAATATALASSPTNCSAGSAPQGINASGTAQNCTAYTPATAGSAILAGNGSGSTSNVTIGTGLSFTGGTLSNTVTNTHGVQVFTSSGIWTAPTGVTQIYLTMVGAGAGSGPAYSNSGYDGGGGGGGAYVIDYPYAVVAGNSYTVTINAGGSGSSSTFGGNGGTTVFDALTINGGSASVSTNGTGGIGGIGGGTGFGFAGFNGAAATFNQGGYGGGSPFGTGGLPSSVGGNGAAGGNGTGYGSGGGGSEGPSYLGGSGTSGIVIVQW